MDPKHLFMDRRLVGGCAYCGRRPATRDHVPPRVLLDEPYPENLPVVDSCHKCNERASRDEEYVACLVESVVSGSSNPEHVARGKVRNILEARPRLRVRIAAGRSQDLWGRSVWQPESDRVRNVLLKLARGHAAYELYPRVEEPEEMSIVPLASLSEQESHCHWFEDGSAGYQDHTLSALPELGTRAFMRTVVCLDRGYVCSWLDTQPGRYRYAVTEQGGVLVRLVLSEYLACWVRWR